MSSGAVATRGVAAGRARSGNVESLICLRDCTATRGPRHGFHSYNPEERMGVSIRWLLGFLGLAAIAAAIAVAPETTPEVCCEQEQDPPKKTLQPPKRNE